jgi:hypothetical protein
MDKWFRRSFRNQTAEMAVIQAQFREALLVWPRKEITSTRKDSSDNDNALAAQRGVGVQR